LCYASAYHHNGRVRNKGAYKNGKEEGPWAGYHDNGQLLYMGAYNNGKREGPWVYYDKDGTKADHSGTYRNGVKVSY
jgi:antitoxin component YwqK of YwqJK toxin-antitoxin module